MTSVVFFANGVGDYIINRPALHALGQLLPGPTHLICSRGPHRFIVEDLPFQGLHATEIWQLAEGGRGIDLDGIDLDISPDLFISLTPWISEDLRRLRDRLAPRRTVGFFRCYDQKVPIDRSKNAVELAFDITRAAVGEADLAAHRRPLRFEPTRLARVEALLEAFRAAGRDRLLVVHADTAPAKMWRPDGFGAVLCEVLSARPDLTCVVVGRAQAVSPCACHAARVVRLQGAALETSVAVTTRADAFLGIDSCMLHAADLAGVPGVGLFGPTTEPHEFGFYWSAGRHLRFASPEDLTPVPAAVRALLELLPSLRTGPSVSPQPAPPDFEPAADRTPAPTPRDTAARRAAE